MSEWPYKASLALRMVWPPVVSLLLSIHGVSMAFVNDVDANETMQKRKLKPGIGNLMQLGYTYLTADKNFCGFNFPILVRIRSHPIVTKCNQ